MSNKKLIQKAMGYEVKEHGTCDECSYSTEHNSTSCVVYCTEKTTFVHTFQSCKNFKPMKDGDTK